MTHFGSYPQHSDKLLCPKCGKSGAIIWEDVPRAGSTARELSGIKGEFYERISNKAPHPIEIVCKGCGIALPG